MAQIKEKDVDSTKEKDVEEKYRVKDNPLVEKTKFKIKPSILQVGYSATIDGKHFNIAKNIIGDVYGEDNTKRRGIAKKGGVIRDGKVTGEDFLTDLSAKEIYILGSAGVIETDKTTKKIIDSYIDSVMQKKE
jgi:hypothetical protein